ncbi:MAG: NAD(+) diphosphatase [Proteobacteria bacterium]|nr:NAD(+) diphosphatase [Pseudomonadota bacterium]
MLLLPHNPNAFTRSPLDRAGHRRRDAEWLADARKADATRVIPFFERRPFVTEEDGRAAPGWLGAHALARITAPDDLLLFLGLDAEGAAHFAVEISEASLLADIGRFDDLRALGPRLSHGDLAILGCAKSIFEWHARHRFCANCGQRSCIAEAGWKRECPACKAEHFPRVDPVVIMVPTLGERCLLGRQKVWPRGMHSALAGYVEPGETVEEAVARETLEEAGLRVREVRVHSTQPWPFPHSLMIGALADVENDDITIDGNELESARWFTRDEACQLVAGNHPDCFAPPAFAIAHQILKSWTQG